MNSNIQIAESASVSPLATIGDRTKVFDWSKIRERVVIGIQCDIRNHCYVDAGVRIGDYTKLMDGVRIYRPWVIGNRVFVGPGAQFANERHPRSLNIRDLEGIVWSVGDNATIGMGAIVLSDLNIGEFALIGAGTIVTKSVPPYGLVVGSPGKLKGFVCANAHPMKPTTEVKDSVKVYRCNHDSCTENSVEIPIEHHLMIEKFAK